MMEISSGILSARQEHRLRALRANQVFGTDEKRIRTEDAVIVDYKNSAKVLSKILDCVRMRFSSARNRGYARTDLRQRKCNDLIRGIRP